MASTASELSAAPHAAISISDLCEASHHIHDEDVQLAVEALGGLRNAGGAAPPSPPPRAGAVATTTAQQLRTIEALSSNFVSQMSLAHQQQSQQAQQQQAQQQQAAQQQQQQAQAQPPPQTPPPAQAPSAFLQRVTGIPLVGRSISQISTVYAATKNASGIVRYSAESVESGIHAVARPVLSTLEPALAPLDRFACSQLDRLERSVPYIFGGPRGARPASAAAADKDHPDPAASPLLAPRSPAAPPFSPSSSASSPSLSDGPYPVGLVHRGSIDERMPSTAPHVERKPRSRFHQVVMGVGASMGMLSEETLRALRYCLQYLQYAINNIDNQIGLLRQNLVSAGGALARLVTGTPANQPSPPLSPGSGAVAHPSHAANILALLAAVKREIVETIRKVVEMVGRHAAIYLPGDARQSVRGFILNLPSRLAALTQPATPAPEASPDSPAAAAASEEAAAEEARRVLALASESSGMLKGIESVFSRSIDVSERVLGNAPPSELSPPLMAPSSSSGASSAAGVSSAVHQLPHLHVTGNSTMAMRRRRPRTSSRSSRASAPADDDVELTSESLSHADDDDARSSRAPGSRSASMDTDS
ncbi:transcriptional regulator opi1 [Polyrhizophydium stewartii]|uniref:Transcriptional regulator opi1 n=1 Tax=Polyrhizophydium stewartii TaxID=2732419 RepID=A0ABR4NFA5_9FUNG